MTETPTIVPFPASPYCRVRARVASIWADGPDDGTHPDWRPAAGEKVTLTPSIGSQLLTYDVGGADPIIVTVERVDCVVGEDGFLTKSDGRPVYIAPTDDPLLSATGWVWTANIKGKSVVFAAPTGGVVDLALFIAAPATGNTQTWVGRIPELVALLEAGSDPAVLAAAVEDYLAANPPSSAPGGSKVYTSWAEVDAETEPTMGVLVTNDLTPAGLTSDGIRDATFFITTQAQTFEPGEDSWRRQELRMWDAWSGVNVWRYRENNPYDESWSAWYDIKHGTLPNALGDSLADAGNAVVRLDAATFNNPSGPYSVGHYLTNWRTLTGFSELPNGYVDAHVFRAPVDWPSGTWTQTVVVALADGTSRTISRVSTNGTSYGPWTLHPSIHDDTGTRDILSLMSNGDTHYLDWGPQCHIRRIGSVVYFSMSIYLKMPDPTTVFKVHPGGPPGSTVIPAGFRPSTYLNLYGLYHYVEMNSYGRFEVSRFPAHDELRQPWQDGQELICSGSWTTLDPWPTILPGTPA